MNKQEHLYTIISEEAGEIVQATTKILRFGKDNYNPLDPNESNEDALLVEYYQLQAMVEHLQKNGELKTLSEEEINKIKCRKLEKVYKYLEESKNVGTLEEE